MKDVIDRKLHRYGAAYHWLHKGTKRPIGNDWSTAPRASLPELEKTYRKGYNVGVRLGEWSKTPDGYIHVIDVDARVPGAIDAAWDELERLFPNVELRKLPTVKSGSGGDSFHIYFVTDRPFKSRKLAHSDESFVDDKGRKHWEWEIELFGTGKQVACPPSIHPDTGNPYEWIVKFDTLGQPPVIDGDTIEALLEDDGERADNEDICDVTFDEAEAYLADLDFAYWCDDRDGWIKVGMALHHEFGGSKYAFKAWCDFSRQSEKFDAKVQKEQWRSFEKRNYNGRLVTFRTVIDAANEVRLARYHEELKDEFDADPFEGQPEGPSGHEIKAIFDDMDAEDEPEKRTIAAEPRAARPDDDVWEHEELRKYPRHLRTIPGILQEMADYIMATAVVKQPLFALTGALALGSLIAGRVYRTDQDNFAAMQFVNIGTTGSGKENTRKAISRALVEAGLAHFFQGPNMFKSKPGVNDYLMEKPRVIWTPDEFGAYMKSSRAGRDQNKIEAQVAMMEIYGRADSVHAPDIGSMSGMTEQQITAAIGRKVERPSPTMYATSVPENFYEGLSLDDVSSGHLNRMLIVESELGRRSIKFSKRKVGHASPSPALLKWMEKTAFPVVGEQYDREMWLPSTGLHEAVLRPFTKRSLSLLDDLDVERVRLANNHEYGALYDRLTEKAMRLSLILACSCNEKEIDIELLEWARDFVKFHDDAFAHRLESRMGANETGRIVDRLIERLERNRSPMTIDRMMQRCQPFKNMDRRHREEVLSLLRIRDDVEAIPAMRDGREKEKFVLRKFRKKAIRDSR